MGMSANELATCFPGELEGIRRVFPSLKGPEKCLTSPPTAVYNCIAWAGDVDQIWWWPTTKSITGVFWPKDIPRNEYIESFYLAFETLDFVQIDESDIYNYEKTIAFMGKGNIVTHAMKLMPDGKWSSKLGKGFDISHDIDSLNGDFYGEVIGFMGKTPKK